MKNTPPQEAKMEVACIDEFGMSGRGEGDEDTHRNRMYNGDNDARERCRQS